MERLILAYLYEEPGVDLDKSLNEKLNRSCINFGQDLEVMRVSCTVTICGSWATRN